MEHFPPCRLWISGELLKWISWFFITSRLPHRPGPQIIRPTLYASTPEVSAEEKAVNKICLSWFRKRLGAAVVILASVLVPACRSGTANPTTSRNPSSTEASAAPPQCDPNYSGCVPVASDVDCAGGRGNGPAYVKGPVKVIGKDIYRLDQDGEGIGCE